MSEAPDLPSAELVPPKRKRRPPEEIAKEKARRRRDGREWQDLVRDAIVGKVCRFSHNPNNTGGGFGQARAKAPGDRIFSYRGGLCLLEAKDCEGEALERSKFTFDEEQALWEVTDDGCFALVAIRWKGAGGDKAWLCHYADLVADMRRRGEVRLRLDKLNTMGGVFAYFAPIPRTVTPRGAERYDLIPALEYLRLRGCPEPYKLEPTIELEEQIAAAKVRKKERRELKKAKDAAAAAKVAQKLLAESVGSARRDLV